MFRSLFLSLTIFAAACAAPEDDHAMSKQEAAGLSGKSDSLGDLCDAYGWYGDGICDDFCPRPDEDCSEQCTSDEHCPAGEYCTADTAVCEDTPCAPGESCPEPICAPGECVPEPGELCFSSDDCAAGEHCSTEDGDCDTGCPEGEACPALCSGVCVADDDSEPQSCGGLRPEGSGGTCDPGQYCYFEPGTCVELADAPGACQPRPEGCAEIYDPVCGCDGQTYSNGCFAAAAGVSVASAGECAQ